MSVSYTHLDVYKRQGVRIVVKRLPTALRGRDRLARDLTAVRDARMSLMFVRCDILGEEWG